MLSLEIRTFLFSAIAGMFDLSCGDQKTNPKGFGLVFFSDEKAEIGLSSHYKFMNAKGLHSGI